ncbi:hypothetical protein V2I01_16155 [Micromonospora sp. BRA006-A]|nr:hypothetical protein [Micromonospora sp. BRA006-A]
MMVPKTVFEDRTCVPGTVQNGRDTTRSRTRPRCRTRTTTRCGCRTSRRPTTTRCCTARRASPSGSARI